MTVPEAYNIRVSISLVDLPLELLLHLVEQAHNVIKIGLDLLLHILAVQVLR